MERIWKIDATSSHLLLWLRTFNIFNSLFGILPTIFNCVVCNLWFLLNFVLPFNLSLQLLPITWGCRSRGLIPSNDPRFWGDGALIKSSMKKPGNKNILESKIIGWDLGWFNLGIHDKSCEKIHPNAKSISRSFQTCADDVVISQYISISSVMTFHMLGPWWKDGFSIAIFGPVAGLWGSPAHCPYLHPWHRAVARNDRLTKCWQPGGLHILQKRTCSWRRP